MDKKVECVRRRGAYKGLGKRRRIASFGDNSIIAESRAGPDRLGRVVWYGKRGRNGVRWKDAREGGFGLKREAPVSGWISVKEST